MNKLLVDKIQYLVNEYSSIESSILRENIFNQICKLINPYIQTKIRNFIRTDDNFYEDALQDAIERLFYCVNNYDNNSNARFITYAVSSIIPYVKDRVCVYRTGGLFGSGRSVRRITKDVSIHFVEIQENHIIMSDSDFL